MAFDSFIRFTGGTATTIKGETTDSVYSGCFEISEFSFGAENTLNITSANTGAGAGKATFKEFKVKKQTDLASPLLLQTLGLGDHYNLVQLYIRKSGGGAGQGVSGKAYLVFAFGMVAVKSIDWSGSTGDDVPTEEVVFEFGEIFIGYYQQTAQGGLSASPSMGGWSKLLNNKSPSMVTSGSIKP
jgi:type VI secretion system secreted protein Hcp